MPLAEEVMARGKLKPTSAHLIQTPKYCLLQQGKKDAILKIMKMSTVTSSGSVQIIFDIFSE